MRLPQFTAEASLYRSRRSYGTTRRAREVGRQPRLLPQLAYACDGDACVCHGASDCLQCGMTDHCSGHCLCDDHDTCLCDGIVFLPT